MSLLMEALRKAEEAKSKAAEKDKDTPAQDADSPDDQALVSSPVDDAPVSTAAEQTAASAPPVLDDPVAEEPPESADDDNPLADLSFDDLFPNAAADTDEPETGSQADSDDGIADENDDIEQIEFTTSGGKDPAAPTSEFHDDDELSLFQSTYFSRNQANAGITDDDLEDSLDETESGLRAAPREPEPDAFFTDDDDDLGHSLFEDDVAADEGLLTADAGHDSEDDIRDSASSMFQAKKLTQQKRYRKLALYGGGVLLIPFFGGLFWFYTQLTGTPSNQYSIPANVNMANRGFLDTPDPGAEADITGSAGDTVAANVSDDAAPAQSDTPVTESGTAIDATPSRDDSPAGDTGLAAADTGLTTPDEAPAPPAAASETPTVADTAPDTGPAQPRTIVQLDTPPSAPAAQASADPVSLVRRTQSAPVVNPILRTAYDTYQQGDYFLAGQQYQQALNEEPNNRDAMLGLASVYLKTGSPAMALNLYSRLLELNPRDPMARAGLLASSQGNDPVRQENELKALIRQYPDSAPLAFALGNLYAAQNRWNEAQSAYFDALLIAKSSTIGDISPDYAFNLAVSLERLNQPGPALDYYREAETHAQSAVPGFDPALLRQRLSTLEQAQR